MYASAGQLAVPAYTTYSAPAYQAHAYAPAVYQAPLALQSQHYGGAYGTTSQNVIRSYDGTVSQYAKAVDTPFSSVRKQDTRITNNLYSPGLAYQYAAPAHHQIIAAPAATYAHPTAYAATAYPQHAGYGQHAAYAPAAVVSHVSFDGLGAHYAW